MTTAHATHTYRTRLSNWTGFCLHTHRVRSSQCFEVSPSSKVTSVKSSEWYSPRSTEQERSRPFRTLQSRILLRPHDTILKQDLLDYCAKSYLQTADRENIKKGTRNVDKQREAQEPCVIEAGNLHGADVHVCVHLGQDAHVTVSADILSVPYDDHLLKSKKKRVEKMTR